MIIAFSIGNYRSFHDIQTINFRATNLVSEKCGVDESNVFQTDGIGILKTIGIYGANGSGKSNLIKGLNFFKTMVSYSLDSEDQLENGINPFKLSNQNIDNDGFFQVILLLEGKKYRYGFTLKENRVYKEWLYGPAEKNETYYFQRENQNILPNSERFREGLNLPYEKLRTDTLFLSFCSSYDGEVSKMIKGFISNKMSNDTLNARQASRFRRIDSKNVLTNRLLETGKKSLILNWMKEAGIFVNDVSVQDVKVGDAIVGNYVMLSKNTFDSSGDVIGSIPMSLEADESAGTQKFYSYIGRLNQKFDDGGVYISDEIDSNFHPSLLQKIIKLFQNSSVNKANAQLLFTSHDTNLMNPDLLRRDQFYFTEKSKMDETILYSLSDLKGIRNNADFARQYLAGFYGAMPILGNYLEEM